MHITYLVLTANTFLSPWIHLKFPRKFTFTLFTKYPSLFSSHSQRILFSLAVSAVGAVRRPDGLSRWGRGVGPDGRRGGDPRCPWSGGCPGELCLDIGWGGQRYNTSNSHPHPHQTYLPRSLAPHRKLPLPLYLTIRRYVLSTSLFAFFDSGVRSLLWYLVPSSHFHRRTTTRCFQTRRSNSSPPPEHAEETLLFSFAATNRGGEEVDTDTFHTILSLVVEIRELSHQTPVLQKYDSILTNQTLMDFLRHFLLLIHCLPLVQYQTWEGSGFAFTGLSANKNRIKFPLISQICEFSHIPSTSRNPSFRVLFFEVEVFIDAIKTHTHPTFILFWFFSEDEIHTNSIKHRGLSVGDLEQEPRGLQQPLPVSFMRSTDFTEYELPTRTLERRLCPRDNEQFFPLTS